MKRDIQSDALDDNEPLVDLTEALALRSKRTNRLLKKQRKKTGNFGRPKALLDLPRELLLEVSSWLRPSDIFVLSHACMALRDVISKNEHSLAKRVLDFRYATISKCLPLPVRIGDVPKHIQRPLRDRRRQEIMAIHRKPYQHIPLADPTLVCTCLTCMLRWNSLCLAVDFAHWQANLEQGEPIPMIDRGKKPLWNRQLLERTCSVVLNALRSQLWYIAILQSHLSSIVKSISRHSANKGNRRRRFRMTPEDASSGTDRFLDGNGPPTLEFPFHRDNYYMLEVYLPNRGWSSEQQRWLYVLPSQHENDLDFILRWAERIQHQTLKDDGPCPASRDVKDRSMPEMRAIESSNAELDVRETPIEQVRGQKQQHNTDSQLIQSLDVPETKASIFSSPGGPSCTQPIDMFR